VTTSVQATGDRVGAILRATCQVVVAEGAHELRVSSVAERAGVSKALVHYYFSTRQELMRAAFAFAEDERERALEAELEELPSGAERVERALLRAVDPEDGDTPALWNEVWSSLRSDPELRPLVQERYRAWTDRIVRLVFEGQADGSVPGEVEASPAGWRLAAAADGLESILYLGLLDVAAARALLSDAIARELMP